MSYKVSKASGRGKCAECLKPIKVGEKQLVIEKGGPYYFSNRYCNKCGIDYMKRDIEHDKKILKKLRS